MEELELKNIVGKHGHSSSKKQKLTQSSEENTGSGSASGSAGSGSAGSGSEGSTGSETEENIQVKKEPEKKLLLSPPVKPVEKEVAPKEIVPEPLLGHKKKKKDESSSEESSESYSGSGSESGSASGSAIEELHKGRKEIIQERKLKDGQDIDAGYIPQNADVPHTAVRGFLVNVIKERKFKISTLVINIGGEEFNFIANQETDIQVGVNPGTLSDLLPNETVVFTTKNNSVLSSIRIIAGIVQGIVGKVDYIADTIDITTKKKR